MNEKRKILVLNGPNLNLIGRREPKIYGNKSFEVFIPELQNLFPECEIAYFQTNHEGVLIDKLQEAVGTYDGIVFNPGGYAHTSIAIADAVRAVEVPVVEVHISDIYKREPFRRHSFVSEACVKTIVGLGLKGYEEAVRILVEKNNL